MEDKILGGMVGCALGDALGAPWERGTQAKRLYKNPDLYTGQLDSQIANFNFYTKEMKKHVIGAITDDTEMTITLARSIVNNKGYDANATAMEYMDFANSCPFLGKNTRALFHGVKTLKGYQKRFANVEPSQGNGSLMRAFPLTIFSNTDNIIEDCCLSNSNRDNKFCSKIYHGIVRSAFSDEIMEIEFDSKTDWEECITGDKKGWVYLPLYLYSKVSQQSFFKKADENTFRKTMKYVITKGGDTDTNGAIVGAITGALVGFEKMMEDPITSENWDIVVNADSSMGDYPRPDKFHPRHIPSLSKKLTKLYEE